ncbi:hypothetical protein [Teredinibacter haidensis]|uniref:hypothetical protein n=1 Tax=Teredinibacter haidensis TaxID=2731755 RepID=UPI000948E70B|nr:hypothetical protein [Teredinibacter haidensis]
MIAAARLLEAVRSHLSAELLVPSLGIGVAEPATPPELPAVVVSLAQLLNPSRGLGEHRQLQNGALAERTAVDLSNPVLADDTAVSLLSADRLKLTLLHGGLVDASGSNTPLGAADIQVERNGVPFTLVAASPGAGEFTVNAAAGQLTFGAGLPADGLVEAEYFIGQWERVVYQLRGLLRIASVAGNNVDAESLSDLVYDAMSDQTIQGLRDLEIINIGPVTTFREFPPPMRVRTLEWQFDYESIVELPDASGGIIERITLLSSQDGLGVEEEQIVLE